MGIPVAALGKAISPSRGQIDAWLKAPAQSSDRRQSVDQSRSSLKQAPLRSSQLNLLAREPLLGLQVAPDFVADFSKCRGKGNSAVLGSPSWRFVTRLKDLCAHAAPEKRMPWECCRDVLAGPPARLEAIMWAIRRAGWTQMRPDQAAGRRREPKLQQIWKCEHHQV